MPSTDGACHAQCSGGASPLSYPCEQGGMIMTFTHVLVPTDFSAPAEQALRYARAEAAVHHAKVTLLHVLSPQTGTDVYVIAGAPRAEVGFDPALEGRFGASIPPQPTVLLHDHHEDALTHVRDFVRPSFNGP